MTETGARAAGRDEGKAQTRLIMAAVKGRRTELNWSAEKLAEEMRNVGVPWKADVVVNLEHGRRTSLRVHELLALAYVLSFDSPVDLLVPNTGYLYEYPVTPETDVSWSEVRAWIYRDTGPLAEWLRATPEERTRIEREREEVRARSSLLEPGVREVLRKYLATWDETNGR